ncbi:DUF1702 family protein [Kribbella sp. CA-294648]|uniref:DUF1702 family protein n=1 Tax=Kribbella sp. CA-294648 TaxID=3239948 RepID=UPI003D90909D
MFGISDPSEVFRRPGFAPECWSQFGHVLQSLADGYNASLEDPSLEVLIPRLEAADPPLHGFAYEGAAMGLHVLDLLAPRKDRITSLLAAEGGRHMATVYVGVGMAAARLHRKPERMLNDLDPVLGWAVIDGYGFHEGFFARRRSIDKQIIPPHVSPAGRPVYDQGLGRSIWFSSAGQVPLVARIISAFDPHRRGDLWSGAAIACSFAGGADRAALDQLAHVASDFSDELSWAAAAAAWTRDQAGNAAPHTDLACEILGPIDSRTAAGVLTQARCDAEAGPTSGSGYARWRNAAVSGLRERTSRPAS